MREQCISTFPTSKHLDFSLFLSPWLIHFLPLRNEFILQKQMRLWELFSSWTRLRSRKRRHDPSGNHHFQFLEKLPLSAIFISRDNGNAMSDSRPWLFKREQFAVNHSRQMESFLIRSTYHHFSFWVKAFSNRVIHSRTYRHDLREEFCRNPPR